MGALSATLAARGLDVWIPVDAAAFGAACAPVAPGLTLEALLPGARGALVVGSAGRGFFDGFSRAVEASDGLPNPLDRYTRAIVGQAARAALEPLAVRHVERFPFLGGDADGLVIPFQRLGRAAGLAPASPLGLQIHPIHGAWWAYRALIVVDIPLPASAPLFDACAGCPAPCVEACPGGAVQTDGFSVAACHARRLADESCHRSCAARLACVRAPERRYSDEQLAFHMAASMPRTSASGAR